MTPTTVMAFDFGTQKIGVAFGQTLTNSARPIDCLKAEAGKPDWTKLKALVAQWGPDYIAVGLPLNLDGTQSALSEQARKFARRLSHQLSCPIALIDERLSTKTAETLMPERITSKKKKRITSNLDAWAAVVIASTWLSQYQSAPESLEIIAPGQRSTHQQI